MKDRTEIRSPLQNKFIQVDPDFIVKYWLAYNKFNWMHLSLFIQLNLYDHSSSISYPWCWTELKNQPNSTKWMHKKKTKLAIEHNRPQWLTISQSLNLLILSIVSQSHFKGLLEEHCPEGRCSDKKRQNSICSQSYMYVLFYIYSSFFLKISSKLLLKFLHQ